MRSEINKKMNFESIRYSMVWEDIDLLYRGLQINAGDDILSISSAGCNSLGLLLKEPRSVTSVDLNPSQNALVALKVQAIANLDYGEFVQLLGFRPSESRLDLYEKIRAKLDPDYQGFWDENSQLIRDGICLQGRLENYIKTFQDEYLYKMVDREKVDAAFKLNSKEEQLTALEGIFNEELIEKFKWYFGEEMMASHGRDKAQFEYVDGDVGGHFWKRFKYAFTELELNGNFYLEYFLRSDYGDLTKVHPYLLEENFYKLRSLLNRLTITTTEMEQLLEVREKGFFSKANFSDIFEYMSEVHAEQFFQNLRPSFREEGRICYWCLLVPRPRSEKLSGLYRSHQEEADQLWATDRSWFYRSFHIEEVI